MGVIDGLEKVSGFPAVEQLVVRALGDLAEPWGLFGARPGMTLEAIRGHFGAPTVEQLDRAEQRTLEYAIPLDHPEEGPREHHLARVVVSSYHGAPVQGLDMSVSYFCRGADLGPAWLAMGEALRAHVTGALGKPAKKKKKTEATWTRGDEQLWLKEEPGKLQISISRG